MLTRGRWSRREIIRSKILLMADEHKNYSCKTISEQINCNIDTVRLTRKRFREEGLEAALGERPRSGQPKRLSPAEEAYVLAKSCTPAPTGHDHWTLELLQQQVYLRLHKRVGQETIRQTLKNKEISPEGEKNVGNPQNYRQVQAKNE